MSAKLEVLRQCVDRVEAETIRIRLASEEIPALITGTDAGTALSLGGAPTSRLVRVEVEHSDFERADVLLKADHQRAQEAGSWRCPRCHEHNGSAFDICWSCNKTRNESENEQHAGNPETTQQLNSHEPFETGKDSITPPPARDDDSLVDHLIEIRNAAVSRCARAAIVGLLILPPLLSVYSIYLLLRLDPAVYHDPGTRLRVWSIWAANVSILLLGTAFWLML